MLFHRVSICALLCAQAFAALAQETVVTLPEVIVKGNVEKGKLAKSASTASRLGVAIREVPASVEVLDHEQISEHGKRQIMEALEISTGITAASTGSTPLTVSVRGFTNNAVRYLYDGIDLGGANTTGRPGTTFNLDRIEILRGPASVLYGNGAIGGAINFITKTPTRSAEPIDVELGAGSFGSGRVGIGTGGVISEDAAYYRFDVSGSHSDGGIVDSKKDFARVTGSLLFDLTDRLSLSLHLDHTRDRNKDFYFGTPLNNGQIDPSLRKINYNNLSDNHFSAENTLVRANIEWRLNPDWELRNSAFYSTANRDWRNIETYTFNPSTKLVARDSFGDVSHDQQVTGNRFEALNKSQLFGLNNRVAFGFEINNTDFRTDRNGFVGSDVVNAYNPATVLSSSLTGVVYRTPARDVSIDKTSVFVEDQLSLTSQLKLVAGVRHDQIKTHFTFLDAGGVTRDPSFSPTNSRLGVVYDALPWLTVYGQYSKATEPVGTLLLLSATNTTFDLTKGVQYEIGTKSSFLDGRAEVTTAIYEITKKNVLTRDPSNPSQNISVGQQSARGFELAGAFRPNKQWRFDGNMAILSARFDDFSERVNGVAVSRVGNVPIDVPEKVANLGGRYYPKEHIYVGSYGRYVGQRFATNSNSVVMPSYTTLDLTAGYRLDKKTELAFWVRNATDKLYALWSDGINAGTQVILGTPRSFELVLKSSF